jgi:hypothetical protein
MSHSDRRLKNARNLACIELTGGSGGEQRHGSWGGGLENQRPVHAPKVLGTAGALAGRGELHVTKSLYAPPVRWFGLVA